MSDDGRLINGHNKLASKLNTTSYLVVDSNKGSETEIKNIITHTGPPKPETWPQQWDTPKHNHVSFFIQFSRESVTNKETDISWDELLL